MLFLVKKNVEPPMPLNKKLKRKYNLRSLKLFDLGRMQAKLFFSLHFLFI